MSQRKFTMTIGAITGLIMSLISVYFYLSGNLFSAVTEYANAIVILGAVSYSCLKYNKTISEPLSFFSHLQIGTATSFWSAVILAFTYFILVNYIDKSLFENFINYLEAELIKASGETESTKELVAELRKSATPNMIAFQKFLGKTMLGFLFSLPFGLYLTIKQNKEKS